jgi:hypothetical protein
MLTKCIACGCWIETDFGADSPAEHLDAEGTVDDPRSPGDTDELCDVCDYNDTMERVVD